MCQITEHGLSRHFLNGHENLITVSFSKCAFVLFCYITYHFDVVSGNIEILGKQNFTVHLQSFQSTVITWSASNNRPQLEAMGNNYRVCGFILQSLVLRSIVHV